MPSRPRRRPQRRRIAPYARDLNHAIPNIPCIPIYTMTARYFASPSMTAGTELVTSFNSGDLMFIPGGIAATTTHLYPIAQSFRLRKITAWASPYSDISGTSVNQPLSASLVLYDPNGRSQLNSDVSTSFSSNIPVMVSKVPKADTFPGMWYQLGVAETLCDLVLLPNSSSLALICVDVTIDFTLSSQTISPSFLTVSNSMTVGATYYTPLDGIGTHGYTRAGLPTIF